MMNFQENEDFSDGNVSDVNTGTEVRWKRVDSPKGWTIAMRRYYNRPCKRQRYFDWKKILSDIRSNRRTYSSKWPILHQDVYPIHYIRPRCKICRQSDHLENTCPRKRANCSICGRQGHTAYRCWQKKCLNCGERNEDFVDACWNCRNLCRNKCKRCSTYGHESQDCPDLWRRFHCTTEYKEINKASVVLNKNIQCCNCAQSGHLFEDCKKTYWTRYLPTSNFVTDYTGLVLDNKKPENCDGSSRINSNWTDYKADEEYMPNKKRPRIECSCSSDDEVTSLPTSTRCLELNNGNTNKNSTLRCSKQRIHYSNIIRESTKKKKKKRKKKRKKNNE